MPVYNLCIDKKLYVSYIEDMTGVQAFFLTVISFLALMIVGSFSSPSTVDAATSISFTSSADTYVHKGNKNRNYGAEDVMWLQKSGKKRALVRFDQEEIEASVSGTILSATLSLTIDGSADNKWGDTGRTIDIHRLVSEWAEGDGMTGDRGSGAGATWNCAIDSDIGDSGKDCSGSTEWDMDHPSIPFVNPWIEMATDTQTIINSQSGVVEFDVTADVQSFIATESAVSNYGWLVKKTDETKTGKVSFETKENTSAPELTIIFEP